MKKSKPFYGWFALTGVVLVTLLVGGAFINAFGVFLPVFSDEFGWSRADISLALSLGILAFGLPSMLFSTMVNKYGARFTIVVGNLLAAFGVAALFFVKDIWLLYLLYIFIGITAGFGGYIACTTVANNWFVKKRSLAMSLVSSATGIGGLVFPPVVTALIKGITWQGTWLVLGGVVALTAIFAGGLLVRNRPEDMGQEPDGIKTSPDLTPEQLSAKSQPVAAWSMSRILKMPVTWLILGFVVANAFSMGAVNAHQIAYFKDIGFDAMTAAGTMSVMSVFSLTGSLAFGALALKINMRYLASAGLVSQFIGLILLLSTKNLTLLFVYAGFMGLGVGALFAAMPSFLGAYYPREHYAQVTGVVLPFHVVAQAVSSWAVGSIYDATGKYTIAFLILGICVMGGSVCAYFAKQPKNI
ncbi:MAG: MFS transporter [Dehalococcoidales bacterium]